MTIESAKLQNSTNHAITYSDCCAPVLRLTLKKYWFDMIKSGVKKEEYREIKDYWVNRLCVKHPITVISGGDLISRHKGNNYSFKNFSIIEFKNGYAKDAPTIRIEFKGIKIGKPKIEWCIDAIDFDQDNGSYDDCFIIELGNVLF